MATGQRVDPYTNFAFRVEIDGITQGHFRECTGLSVTVDAIENPEGGVGHISKLPGRTKHANLVLKWGLTDSRELYDWHRTVVDGKVRRASGSIVQLDATGKEVLRWNFVDGWPSRWEGPSFNAGASEISVETLEIAHEGLVRG
jgi:phage tail-like protein